MQVLANTTGMQAAVTVAADKDAHDYCIVVVKGTFVTGPNGILRLAQEQRPFVYADEHYSDPETSAIRYESDFAPKKPLTDVVVVGKAVAPHGQAVASLSVRLEIEDRVKEITVIGDRKWERSWGRIVPSQPLPFREMSLTFDRAFGGIDDSKGPTQWAAEQRNLVGVGYHRHRSGRDLVGTPLPNLEDPRHPISSPSDHVPPAGLGFVGRSWQPRASRAGTYDQHWREQVCPLLPADFDDRYFQSAPEDQQFTLFRGGEVIRCIHMSSEPVVQYTIPTLRIPIRFQFTEHEAEEHCALDTVLLEPHEQLATLLWRARIRLGRKPSALRWIFVGQKPESDGLIGYRRGKPVFAGLADASRWLRDKGDPRS